MTNPFDLTGSVALVTGSSRGIGAALAEGLAGAVAVVVLNSRDADALEKARTDLAARTGTRVEAVAFDVTDDEAVTAAVADVEARVGPIGVLVNNAGVQHRVPMLDLDLADWRRVLEANLTGPFPGRAGGGAAHGCALTRTMCAEWAGAGVQANAIAPGYFDTVLTPALVKDPTFDAWVRDRAPAGRRGRPEEIVGTLLWLASAASDFVNGQVVFVDGGMSAVV